jgi:hypothetical protein
MKQFLKPLLLILLLMMLSVMIILPPQGYAAGGGYPKSLPGKQGTGPFGWECICPIANEYNCGCLILQEPN